MSVGGGAVANCGDGRQDEVRAAPRSPRGWGDRAMLWLTRPTPKTMTRAWPAVYQCGRSGTKRIHRPPCAFSLHCRRKGMTNTQNNCLDRSRSQKMAFLTHPRKTRLVAAAEVRPPTKGYSSAYDYFFAPFLSVDLFTNSAPQRNQVCQLFAHSGSILDRWDLDLTAGRGS